MVTKKQHQAELIASAIPSDEKGCRDQPFSFETSLQQYSDCEGSSLESNDVIKSKLVMDQNIGTRFDEGNLS